MSSVGYLTIEDIVPSDFLQKPMSVIVEAGNGMGKTHVSSSYSVSLQKLGLFDRIYILQYSQKGCENVVNKISKLGGWCIWHLGLEKFCPFYNKIRRFVFEGIPAAFFCYVCPYFKNKSRLAYRFFENELSKRRIVKPKIYPTLKDKVCTHPVLRSYSLDPSANLERRVGVRETPIFVMPAQVFLNHAIVLKWLKYSKRQKKPRQTLLIIDEADTIFYSALKTEVRFLDPTRDDYDLLRTFSPKTKRLERILDVYQEVVRILDVIYKEKGRVSNNALSKLKSLLDEVDPLLRSFDRRKKAIVDYVFKNKVRTCVFKAVLSLMELVNIENLELALQTIELVDDAYVIYDYDYGIKLLFSTEFPWKYFWKIALSATMPTEKILESPFVSNEAKRLLMKVERRFKTYENVYVSRITIFESIEGILNRNQEIQYSVPRILEAIKLAIEKYKELASFLPRGVTLWFGNSKQLNTFVQILSRTKFAKSMRRGRGYAIFFFRGIPVFCSYAGSRISRGIDMTEYDISIVIGPLLRPPRPAGFLDVIDFARGVSETIQSAMRIVRSPKPDRPKLVILERHMTTAFYAHFYPEWFKQLYITHKVTLH